MSNLVQLFREFNEGFWDGRLPRYGVRYSSLPAGKKGECRSERRVILLACRLEGDELRRTLLHEMCHIGCPGHGQKFQARLMRLAEQGEQWAAEEAEDYRGVRSWNDSMKGIRDDLPSIAIQKRTFRSVVVDFAADFGIRPAEFLRRVPWLKAAWQKARREAEQIKRHRRGRAE